MTDVKSSGENQVGAQAARTPLPLASAGERTEFGLTRSVCDCAVCVQFCHHRPGFLIPSDLGRLIPPNVDPLAWAREHLRVGRGDSLVPARQQNGACHWLTPGDRCAVHAEAPYGCAFFCCFPRQSHKAAHRAARLGAVAIADDRQAGGLYSQICDALRGEGLLQSYSSESDVRMERYASKVEENKLRRVKRERKKRRRKAR